LKSLLMSDVQFLVPVLPVWMLFTAIFFFTYIAYLLHTPISFILFNMYTSGVTL
jgi:hypothetical protein